MTGLRFQLLQRFNAAVSDPVPGAGKGNHLKTLLFAPLTQQRFVPDRVINGPLSRQSLADLIF